jgi:hypothetical protein
VLRAGGQADVPLHAIRSYWVDPKKDVHDFYLRIEPRDVPRMQLGVVYSLVPRNEKPDYRWAVADGITLVRDERSVANAARAGRGAHLHHRCASPGATTSGRPSSSATPIRDRRGCSPTSSRGATGGEIKELTKEGDNRFVLAAEGHPEVTIRVNIGGITLPNGTKTDAWVVFDLGSDGLGRLAPGVAYALRPLNEK